jgi:hypothetical protein
MTLLTGCPICKTPRPVDRHGAEPWCCSIACYRRFHDLDDPITGDGRRWFPDFERYIDGLPASAKTAEEVKP